MKKPTTSSEKGRQFEAQVASLYRLLGAEVIQNIEVCNQKVDILATFQIQGSSTKHRVIVECKNEKRRSMNQRVMQFHGLLETARKAGLADSAEIITTAPWSDQAKGFALLSGVSILTFAEKLSKLLDFGPYLQGLISTFKESDPERPTQPPLASYYVAASGEVNSGKRKTAVPRIENFIQQWLSDRNNEMHLALFGDYGSGKSSLCHKLAYDLAVAYVTDPASSRIPILLNLREFIGTLKMEAYITSFLDQQCKVQNPKFELFRAMNDAGLLFLIFDGLDEMAVKVDSNTLEMNLMEIEKLGLPKQSKVLLTSRPEYFVTAEEEDEVLRPATAAIPIRRREYRPIRLLPWGEKQIETFLKKRVPLAKEARHRWTYYRDRIAGIRGLSDLSHRPVLLEMIVKTLPRLIDGNMAINVPNLYRTYLIEEMRRQNIVKRRLMLLKDTERLGLLQLIAADIYAKRVDAIVFTDARKRVEREVGPPKDDLEAYTREFLTTSFLIRRGDYYRFSHKSILEFLVAISLVEEIKDDAPDLFSTFLLEPVVTEFLVQMEPDRSRLWEWILLTKERAHTSGRFLGGNSASILCSIRSDELSQKNLSETNLTGANLHRADLLGTQLTKTVLASANLSFARFDYEDIKSAHLHGAVLSFYFLSHNRTTNLGDRWKTSPVYTHGEHRNRYLMSVPIEINNFEDIEIVRKELSGIQSTQVAVYDREYGTLVRKYGGTDNLR